MSRRNREKATNVSSQLLNDKENETIFNLLGRFCVTLATGITQVYLADTNQQPNRWNKRFCGVTCFVKDSTKKSYYIRVYDLWNEVLLWEQELYNQFRYKSPREYFHTFEADNVQAGLNFASEDEAVSFKRAVETKLQERHKRRMEKKRQTMKVSNTPAPAVINTAPVTSNPPAAAVPVEASRNGTSKKNKNDKGSKKKALTKNDIGTPTNFRHVGHVGWDPTKGFDMNNLDPDMKNLFQSVGISKDDQVDKETIDFIYDFVDKAGGMDAFRKDMLPQMGLPPPAGMHSPPGPPQARSPSGAPPPAPQRTGPPLPSRVPSTRGAAPPPPNRGNIGAPKAPNVPPPRPPMSAPSLPPPRPPVNSPSAPAAPPPPPGVPAPPPPPPPGPPPPPAPGIPAPSPTGHGALLQQIQSSGGGGMKLNPVQMNSAPVPASDPRDNLLNQIRGGAHLKKVEVQDAPVATVEEDAGGLVGALARALASRQKHIQGSDEESDESEEDANDDDSDWDD